MPVGIFPFFSRNLEDLNEYISTLKQLSEVNPKDIAAEKLRLRNVAKQEEKEKRWLEREHQRQLLKEEKNDKKRGRKTKSKFLNFIKQKFSFNNKNLNILFCLTFLLIYCKIYI